MSELGLLPSLGGRSLHQGTGLDSCSTHQMGRTMAALEESPTLRLVVRDLDVVALISIHNLV